MLKLRNFNRCRTVHIIWIRTISIPIMIFIVWIVIILSWTTINQIEMRDVWIFKRQSLRRACDCTTTLFSCWMTTRIKNPTNWTFNGRIFTMTSFTFTTGCLNKQKKEHEHFQLVKRFVLHQLWLQAHLLSPDRILRHVLHVNEVFVVLQDIYFRW